jgi:hypothetical protein
MVQPSGRRRPIPYSAFRSGQTFKSVRAELKVEQHISFAVRLEAMYVRRATVLGRLHQYKQAAYLAYCRWVSSGRRTGQIGSRGIRRGIRRKTGLQNRRRTNEARGGLGGRTPQFAAGES